MRRSTKITLVIVAALAIAAFAGWRYLTTGGARDVSAEAAAFTLVPETVIAEFSANEAKATARYLDKAVAITGVVSAVRPGEVILEDKVICVMQDSIATTPIGEKITVKGRIIGYDSLMEELKIDNTSITNQ